MAVTACAVAHKSVGRGENMLNEADDCFNCRANSGPGTIRSGHKNARSDFCVGLMPNQVKSEKHVCHLARGLHNTTLRTDLLTCGSLQKAPPRTNQSDLGGTPI